MRKSFYTYVTIWAIALIIFNLIIFVIPSSIDGKTVFALVSLISQYKTGVLTSIPNYTDVVFNKYGGAFWPCYFIIILTFIGQLFCAFKVFKETDNQKFFYKISLITISFIGLIVTLVIGTLGMFLPDFPIWLAVLICIIVLAINIVSLLRANLAGNIISDIDDKVKNDTTFLKEMTAKAKALWDQDKDNKDLKRLYEAFRYANPINNVDESKINSLFNEAVNNKNSDVIIDIERCLK